MMQSLLLFVLLFATLVPPVFQGPGGSGGRVIPLKITAVPADSFRRGNTVIFKATFGANRIPPAGGVCMNPSFVLRVYDGQLVQNSPPRITADTTNPAQVIPVTPYYQQSPAPFEPLSGPDALTVEKTFEPMVLPAKSIARLKHLYVGLFHTCDVAKPKDTTGISIIYDDALQGSYMGGAKFVLSCVMDKACTYQPDPN